MRKSSRWFLVLVAAFAAMAFVPPAHAQIIDVEVNGTFTGTIAGAGAEVQARFYATQGATLQLRVQADSGSTLRPTVAVTDSSGQTVAGRTQTIRWLPYGNLIHYMTAPADGFYTATIGAASGSGSFWARLTGNAVAPAPTATLSGTVTDADTNALIAGVTVTVGGVAFDTTDANGDYSGTLAPGTYDVTFDAPGYASRTESVTIADVDVVLSVSLTPVAGATVDASVTGNPAFGATVTATADIQTQAGVNVTGIQWTQMFGTPVTIATPTNATTMVTLGSMGDYKDELITVLSEPPIGEEDLPPNVPLPEGEFPGGLQDRLQVVGVNPFALEEAGIVVLEVEVTTNVGVFTDEVEIHVSVPWVVSTGLRNVPVGEPALVHAVEQGSYAWTLSGPAGSLATLTDPTSQTPYFTPDVAGLYELEVSDGMGGPVSTLQVFAGTWRGVIVDQDMNGRPVPDTACTFCHNDILAPDEFTPWKETGHAEIFTDNLDTSTHYGSSCFPCHTVGYDPGVDNAGIDEAPDWQGFLNSGLLNNPGDNWTTMLDQYPDSARKANIQCENCHGPQDSLGHGFAGPLGEPRASLSSDVCASCHGEPLRHARFQQWQLSGHANYELAIDEGDSGSCSRCHTVNGFLTWLPVLLGDQPGDPLADITVTWTTDETHPQTCVTCHDPHEVGTSSGNDPDVNIRISGDTPPLIAGFQATDVGRGAICMTCHNSRRGLRNDSVWDTFSTSEKARAPHGSAQTDVLMGQNAYLVPVGTPGGHAMNPNTCVDCHMKATPPPDLLSYNQGGANHTFYAELTICSECHSPYLLASDVQNGVQFLLDQVEEYAVDAYYELMDSLIAGGNEIDFDGDFTVTDVADVTALEFGESRGSQALGVTLNGVDQGLYRLTTIDVVDGGGTIIGNLAEFADDDLLKAGWNWNLFNNDSSVGIHNPFFANGALIAARNALIALSPSPAVQTDATSLGAPWGRTPRRRFDA